MPNPRSAPPAPLCRVGRRRWAMDTATGGVVANPPNADPTCSLPCHGSFGLHVTESSAGRPRGEGGIALGWPSGCSQIVLGTSTSSHRSPTVDTAYPQVRGQRSPLTNGYHSCWTYPGLQPDSSTSPVLTCGRAPFPLVEAGGRARPGEAGWPRPGTLSPRRRGGECVSLMRTLAQQPWGALEPSGLPGGPFTRNTLSWHLA